ncbi:hypothetical protein NQ315_008491 [Exocentrus adspersus]|uniref:Uncharacterized protein n=1 Tax=Exocentrus adspersus TaxID=1586481 RepID=A0AAV8W5Z7_9CUCU|nr:hypothetical protein NQ315_008491 [Exocentrus adspersus]
MSFPIIKENTASTNAPLLPTDIFQLSNASESNGEIFTENDLLEAVKDGDVNRLAAIIASDSVDIHLKISDLNNGSLLHFAAQQGLVGVCHVLVTAGIEIDLLDKEQNTALMLAIVANKNDVVEYLIKAGTTLTIKGTDGMTALHIAAKCGNLSACQLLLQAAVTISNFVNSQDDGGWTPLVWACEHGYVEVANFLIIKGADPCLRDVEHNEALHWAAFSGSSNIVELLLNRGCDVNTVNAHGESPLHIAAREDRYNCIIILLARGANVSLFNKNDETPLDCLSEEGESYDVIALNIKMQAITGTDLKSYRTLLSSDISKGRETNPIQCVNAVDDEPEPRDYVYITKNCKTSDSFSIDTKMNSLHVCSCVERCVTDECECTKLSMKCWYDEEGKLTSDFNFADPPLIFECSEACSCNAITCRNRVVQRGLQQRFQLYKTEKKGWSIKTLRFIPKGSYVCEYVGEILTDIVADQRDDDSYLFDLDNRDTESFCIDAKFYGNFARFINHSCSPNLHPIKVFIDHQDLRFPRIALFAKNDIDAEEELSFDYGHKFWLVKYKSFTCHCGATDCKYSEEAIQETLNSYKQMG